MRRLVSKVAGGPDSLLVEDVPTPVSDAGELLVDMHACGLNYPDLLFIEDLYQVKAPRPFSPGSEMAGVVRAVGDGVTGFAPGDRVIGLLHWGGMAEQVVVPVDSCFPMPDGMTFEDGATLIVTYATSLYALQEADLAAGETLLVLGATGGVGMAALELGKMMGARVVAAVSSEEKAAIARAKGADDTIVYPSGPLDREQQRAFGAAIKAACPPGGPNVICDPVGGSYAEPAFRALAFDGRYLVLGFTAGIANLPMNLPLLRSTRLIGISYGAAAARDPLLRARIVKETIDLYEQGEIRPAISARYRLEDAPDAFRAMAARGATGKLVILAGRPDA